MITISLCMIVKNEEDNLGNCLVCIKDIAEQIVIVDTGSTDKTKEVANSFGAEVYDYAWSDNFSDARNFSFSKAREDYILWLDADDILKEEERQKFLLLKESLDDGIDVVYMKYNTAYDENGEATFSYYRERLVQRSKKFRWREPVHEYLEVYGNSFYSDIAVSHNKKTTSYSRRNLEIYEKCIIRGMALSARAKFYYARELKNHHYNDKAEEYYLSFLQSNEIWKEDAINACMDLSYLYETKGQKKEALKILYQSFLYDLPRAEICCRLGKIYSDDNFFNKAIYWYKTAEELVLPNTTGFVQPEYYGLIPNIELCVLYDRLGQRGNAIKCHERAKAIKANHPSVIYNEKYFYNTTEN